MDNLPKTIADIIDVLSNKFGSTGTQLFEMLVRGKFAESLAGAIAGAIFLGVGIGAAIRACNKEYPYGEVPVAGIVAAITIPIGVIFICINIVGVFAPDYALIMSFIK